MNFITDEMPKRIVFEDVRIQGHRWSAGWPAILLCQLVRCFVAFLSSNPQILQVVLDATGLLEQEGISGNDNIGISLE
jgi:hypothetical protein